MSNNILFSDVSPIGVNQKDLIRLSASARVIPLEVLHVKSLQSGSHLSNFKIVNIEAIKNEKGINFVNTFVMVKNEYKR